MFLSWNRFWSGGHRDILNVVLVTDLHIYFIVGFWIVFWLRSNRFRIRNVVRLGLLHLIFMKIYSLEGKNNYSTTAPSLMPVISTLSIHCKTTTKNAS